MAWTEDKTVTKVWELDGVALWHKEHPKIWAASADVESDGKKICVHVSANTAPKALAGLRDALDCVNTVRMWKTYAEDCENEREGEL